MRVSASGLLFIVLLFAGGCGTDRLYEKNYPLPERRWTYADSLSFRWTVPDTSGVYDLRLRVEHLTSFPNQNLYTKVHTRFPSGQRSSQVLSLELMDRSGYWQGDCSGEKCRIEIPIQQRIFFPEPGAYALVLEQFSRRDSLPGLLSIGLEVVQVAEKDGGGR